ncbi:MAG: SdrD B-like domain-containing protein [Steroidobacteraceae bacterium]
MPKGTLWSGAARGLRDGGRRMLPLLVVLLAFTAPLVWASDLVLVDVSDTGYDPVPAGAPVVYSITLENGAPDVSAPATSIFDLPSGTSAASLPAFCAADGGVPTRIVCSHGPLTGGAAPVMFQIGINTTGQPPGTITLRGALGFSAATPAAATPISSLTAGDAFFATDSNATNNLRSQQTTLQNAGDLRIQKTATPEPVTGGGEITYTLTVTNDGPSVSTNFRVVDSLPAAASYVAGSFSGAGWSFNAGTTTATHAGSLAVGASSSFTFRAKVNAGTGNVINAAVVEAVGTPDPNTSNNQAQVSTPVTPGADLTVAKTVAPSPAIAGGSVTFTLTARNLGPSPAQGVTLTDALPAGFVITGGTAPGGWSCSSAAADTVRNCSRSGGDMAPGAVEVITINATVPTSGANSSGDVTNTAIIAAATPDPNGPVQGTDNNQGSVTFSVLADGADLTLSKAKQPALVAVWDGVGSDADSRMTSTIQVRNLGPRAATGQVQVVDELAPGEEFVSVSGSSWSCAVDVPYAVPPARQKVTCDLQAGALPLAVNANAPVLQLVTRARAAGTLTNHACTGGSGESVEPLTAAGINVDPETGNDCSGAGIRTTDERADLGITKRTNGAGTADNVMTVSDTAVEYTIEVSNSGDATTGVVVNDTVPGYVPGRTTVTTPTVPAGWSCSVAGASVVCRSGATPLPNSASATIVVRAERPLFDSTGLGAGSCGGVATSNAFCNTAGVGVDATVPGSVGEVNAANNSASDWLQVERVANVRTTGKVITSSATGQAGVNTSYRMDYLNQGPSTVPGVVFRDVFTLPANDAGFVLVSAARTGGGTTACTATAGAGVTSAAAPGGTSFANPTGVPAQVTIQCSPLSLANQQTEALTVVIRPNVNVGNSGRTFTNIADFFFDRDGDGIADPAVGSDASGNFNFNTDTSAADDTRSASLPFVSGAVDLLTNKEDVGFPGGVDPLGFDATDPSQNLITYRVSVHNSGPSVATNAVITDVLTPQAGRTVRFMGSSTTPGGAYSMGDCTVAAGSNPTTGPSLTLACVMPGAGFSGSDLPGVIAPGQSSTLYLRYRYETPPGASGDTLANRATVSANETDSNPANDAADQETTIRARADLAVSKTMVTQLPGSDPSVALPPTVASVTLRQPFYYVIEVVNNGPGASLSRNRGGALNGTGTVVTDTLPTGVVITGSATWQKIGPYPGGDEQPAGTGSCTHTGNVLTCNLGDVTVTGRVRILVPARWDSYPAGGTSNNTAAVTTEQFDSVPGNNSTTVPLAVTRSSLSGVVFEDRNRAGANGGTRQTAAEEPGIGGVTIRLTGVDAYGNTVNRTTTTSTAAGTLGNYSFTDLAPADAAGYSLSEVQPAGYINGPVAPPATGPAAPTLGGTYAAGAPDSSYAGIAVGGADNGTLYNFPEVRRPSLSGFVYVDGNFNNVRNAGDAAIAGAVIELLDAVNGTVLATATTDAAGAYSFTDLDPLRTYTLREALPAGTYRNRPTAVNAGLVGGAACASGCTPGTGVGGDAATTDRISNIELAAGTDGTLFNFGEDAIAGIAGSVYVDRNGNGDFDAGDAGSAHSAPNGGLANVTVTLTGAGANGVFGDGDDPAPVVVQTSASGAYAFTDIVAGQNYRVTMTAPAGYGAGTENPGGVINVTGLPPTGSSGNDFGRTLASIAGQVFEDFSTATANNNNGSFDAGENPIANVTLTLTGTDLAGNPVNATVQTDASGNYIFRDLLPPQAGTTYTLTETQPAGYIDGRHTAGNAATPGNASTANIIDGIAPSAGQTATGYLFGELANVMIGGVVYLDRNDDGDSDAGDAGLPGATVTIQGAGPDGLFGTADDPPLVTLTTNASGAYSYGGGVTGQNYRIVSTLPTGLARGQENSSGNYTLTNLPTTGAQVDFGLLAASLSGHVWLDSNNNGVRDGGEAGLAGVTVSLPAGTRDVFGNAVAAAVTDANGAYRFADLPAGTYTVTQQVQQPLAGGQPTLNGHTVAGTVAGASTGVATPVTTVPSAISDILLPAGGTSVENNFGEVLGVALSGRVFFDTNDDGAQSGASEPGISGVTIRLTGTDDAGTAVSLTATTDANGDFRFEGLRPGRYDVTEPDQPQGTRNGQTTAGTVGGVASGTATPVATVPSAITVIDLLIPGSVSVNNLFGEIPSGSISGRVYNDGNNNGLVDGAETGLANVQLVLTGTTELGQAVNMTVTTDADGHYRFEDLRPGTYIVTEPTQPPATLNGITTAGTIDGAAVGTATLVSTVPSAISGIVLPHGRQSVDNNFGEIGDSPDLVVGKTATPATFTVNNIGSYVIHVRNAGQQPSDGVYTVEDRLPAGLTLMETPVGNGWNCEGAAGDNRFRCTSSTVVAAGALATDDIHVRVRVAAAAAAATPVNNAVLVSGGGENAFRAPSAAERAAFENNPADLPVCAPAITHNACRLPTPVQRSASVSGTVWMDQGSDLGLLDGGDRRLSGWVVEVVDAAGQVTGTAITAADGRYSIADQVPGVPLSIRFREPSSGVIMGTPVSGETGAPPAPCNESDAIAQGTASSCRSTAGGLSHLAVVLASGENLAQQSLPLNPGGVVYDSVTRGPLPGSRVTLTPVGSCPGYVPEQHLLNVVGGGYTVQGMSVSMTVGAEGIYQFLTTPDAPPSCRFQLSVTPPAGYTFQSTMIPAQDGGLAPPATPGVAYPVLPGATAPTQPAGPATTYYLELDLGSAVAVPVHNHIPLDPAVAPGLAITKTGDRRTVELGDTVLYTIVLRQTAGASLPVVDVIDRLPHGFTYINGSAHVDGVAIAAPAGSPGPMLVFNVGALAANTQKTLTYRARVGVGSQQGDGINRARAHGCAIAGGCVDPATGAPYPAGVVASNQAEYRVIVSGGVFTAEACVLGKIFVDCNNNHLQDEEELGIPGVRLYIEDGTWMISDSEGKYSYCGLSPQSHTMKVDPATLPRGAHLTTSSNRNLGDADSLFLDLKNGELHRADFIEGSCSNPVIEQVKARRTQGEVRAPETERGQGALRFESKPLRAPQQATDSANQRPIVKPRAEPGSAANEGAASREVQP